MSSLTPQNKPQTQTILEEIVAHKRQEIEGLVMPMEEPSYISPLVDNIDRLFTPRPGLIAELKAKSPSEGQIVEHFDPIRQAQCYEAGGATAMSVLTDEKYFGGSFDILRRVRATTQLPLLCKEFIIDERQVRMARACGADMCLLIVKILTDSELFNLNKSINNNKMIPVVEIQDGDEFHRALAVDPEVLLINNRNLHTFDIAMDTTTQLLEKIPPDVKVISASGIKEPSEIRTANSRIDGFLIGTELMRREDPTAFLKECRHE